MPQGAHDLGEGVDLARGEKWLWGHGRGLAPGPPPGAVLARSAHEPSGPPRCWPPLAGRPPWPPFDCPPLRRPDGPTREISTARTLA
jgi:hypothetical protein